jgi:hypothetical protein
VENPGVENIGVENPGVLPQMVDHNQEEEIPVEYVEQVTKHKWFASAEAEGCARAVYMLCLTGID